MNVFHMNVCAVFYLQNALPVLQIHLTVNIQSTLKKLSGDKR